MCLEVAQLPSKLRHAPGWLLLNWPKQVSHWGATIPAPSDHGGSGGETLARYGILKKEA